MKLVYYPKAESDLEDILAYYESKVQGLANYFLDEVEFIEAILSKNPKAFQFRYKNMRAVPLNRFPYMVYYKIVGDTVFIILIISTHQSPIHHKKEIRERK